MSADRDKIRNELGLGPGEPGQEGLFTEDELRVGYDPPEHMADLWFARDTLALIYRMPAAEMSRGDRKAFERVHSMLGELATTYGNVHEVEEEDWRKAMRAGGSAPARGEQVAEGS